MAAGAKANTLNTNGVLPLFALHIARLLQTFQPQRTWKDASLSTPELRIKLRVSPHSFAFKNSAAVFDLRTLL